MAPSDAGTPEDAASDYVPPPAEPRNVGEWVELLELLTTRLAQGRIYRRDLPTLVPAVNHFLDVTDRRIHER